MATTTENPGSIKFRKDFSYAKKTPTFVSNTIGGNDEIARWVLDLNDVLYKDQPHAPLFYMPVVNGLTNQQGPANSPVFVQTDTLMYTADSIVQYFNQKSTGRKLLPADPAKQKEVLDLYDTFSGYFEKNVTAYIYSEMLPHRALAAKWFTQHVPFGEKLRFKLGYGSLRNALIKELKLDEHPSGERLTHIKKVFKQVDELLSDGRRYLTGDTITIADIAFAAVSAPLLLPEEYGGSMAAVNQLPEDMRIEVDELRATPAGQFVLLMYQEDRPTMRDQGQVLKEPGLLGKAGQSIGRSLGRKKTNLFYFLQRRFPVLKIWFTGLVAVNKNDLLTEMLERDNDFTVEEINGKKMANQKGAFFLGFDRKNPQFDREREFVRKTAKREDMDRIRAFIRDLSEEIISNNKAYGKIDVANTLCYTALVRFIDDYFGVPGPSETIMKHWLRVLFYDLFLNFTNNKAKHKAAVDAALERRDWVLQLIKDRRQQLKDGKTLDDNIMNRMILLSQEPENKWADDETLHRNIGGLITGILETTNKAVILVLDELFNRPEALKGAIETAQQKDMKKMYGYVCEAMRFNPAQPGVIRYCEKKQVLKGKGAKNYTIKAKRKVFALTAAAMMDPAAFPDPKKFDPAREAVYMNYGYALHECYGKYINAVTISEFVAAILRLKNVRREPGAAGRSTGLHDGPFFNNFVVTFD